MTKPAAKYVVIEFIEADCNRRRPHSTIGYQMPARAMESFFERAKPVEGGFPWPRNSSSFRVRKLDTGHSAKPTALSADIFGLDLTA